MANKLVPINSKFKVFWDDKPENYSRESKTKIISSIAKKYGVAKQNVNVIFRPVKFNENGDTIEITGANLENIMDVSYQRELMREWLKRENIDIDFDRLIKLDDKVNESIKMTDEQPTNISWSIKWLKLDNFLSFGEDNYIPFTKNKGLTVVNSIPANTGGKTTLTIDALKFLLHGKTTKTDKNEDIFNKYSGKNNVVVRGMLSFNGEDIIIERKMSRTAKKAGGWTIRNEVNYYEILPDGEERLKNEEDAIRTTKSITQAIGTESDFELLVLATEQNLEDLIGLTSTESGKILTRLIGLEVLEKKEEIVRKMSNAFEKTKVSNTHDAPTLTLDIENKKNDTEISLSAIANLEQKLEITKKDIELNTINYEDTISKKNLIDEDIKSMNPSKLEMEINEITKKGITYKDKIDELNKEIDKIKDIIVDENHHQNLTKEVNELNYQLRIKNTEITKNEATIKKLIDSGICETCKRALDDVDNKSHIENYKSLNLTLSNEIISLNDILLKKNIELEELTERVNVVNKRNKLELDRDRLDVEIGHLRNKIVEKKNDLKKYKLNQQAIEQNREIDIKVTEIKTKLSVLNHTKDDCTIKIENLKTRIENNNKDIENFEKLLIQIKKEEEVSKIYGIYIDLVGKKGIGKLVLRSVLPIINSELKRLLDDVCDFEVEVIINDKNEVNFYHIQDGVTKPLKSCSGFEKTASSLALRAVLGRLSSLPMPNFITFDEVMGKVANVNLESLKPLFDKLKDMYELVFLITHNDIVKDWGDNVVTVEKIGNISKVSLK